MVFEPNRHVFRRSGAMVARVLIDPKREQVPVRIFNPCECPVIIRKGDPVGRLEVATSIKHESSTCSPPPSPSSDPTCTSSPPSVHVETNTQTNRPAPSNPPQSHNVPVHLTDLYERSVKELDTGQQQRVEQLLTDYGDVFATSKTDLGKTTLVQHVIDTGQEAPFQEKVRRFPYEQQKEIEKQVNTLREQGVIQPSTGRWASNVVLVKKKDMV